MSEPDVVVSEPDVVVSDPVVVVSEPVVVVSDPVVVVSEPVVVVSEPDVVVSELDVVVSEPDVVVSEPDVVVSEPVVEGDGVDVVRSVGACVVPVVCSSSFWTTERAWSTVLMAEVIEVTAEDIWVFSVVVQVTVEDTVLISADSVTTTPASGKLVTMEITKIRINT